MSIADELEQTVNNFSDQDWVTTRNTLLAIATRLRSADKAMPVVAAIEYVGVWQDPRVDWSERVRLVRQLDALAAITERDARIKEQAEYAETIRRELAVELEKTEADAARWEHVADSDHWVLQWFEAGEQAGPNYATRSEMRNAVDAAIAAGKEKA